MGRRSRFRRTGACGDARPPVRSAPAKTVQLMAAAGAALPPAKVEQNKFEPQVSPTLPGISSIIQSRVDVGDPGLGRAMKPVKVKNGSGPRPGR